MTDCLSIVPETELRRLQDSDGEVIAENENEDIGGEHMGISCEQELPQGAVYHDL